jgi:S1-C subfamily serine protease
MRSWFRAVERDRDGEEAPQPALASRIRPAQESGGKIGLAVRSEGSEVVVVSLKQGAPAELAGVMVGDVLLSIANEVQNSGKLIIKVRRLCYATLSQVLMSMCVCRSRGVRARLD